MPSGYPLYLVTLLIARACIVWPFQINPKTYPVSAAISDASLQTAMLNAWPVIGSGVHWNAPAWSISVEWFCYLFLFPLLLRLGAPRSTPIRLLCIVLLSSASYSMFVRHFDGELSAAQLHQSADKLSYWVDLIRGAFGFTAGMDRLSVLRAARCALHILHKVTVTDLVCDRNNHCGSLLRPHQPASFGFCVSIRNSGGDRPSIDRVPAPWVKAIALSRRDLVLDLYDALHSVYRAYGPVRIA
ncbi:hypothetical protein ACVIM8_003217 [Bradyrhizobium sp. USDA 4529]